jgi:capsular exopolysaccharide synthesis family protein
MKGPTQSADREVVLLEPQDRIYTRRQTAEGAEASDLRAYWQVARKHQRKILACFGAALVVSLIIAFSTTPIYVAKTTLLVERKDPQVVNIKQVLSEAVDAEEGSYYESQYGVLRSRTLAAEVIKAQGLDKNPAFAELAGDANLIARLIESLLVKPIAWSVSFFTPSAVVESVEFAGVNSQLIDAYLSLVDIEPVKRSRLVRIAVSGAKPALIAQIADAHAAAYIRQGFALRSQANEEARKFLESKLAELKQRFQTSESRLNDFRQEKGIISLDEKENIIVERLADLNRRLTEAEAERIGLEAQKRLINRREYNSLPAVLSHPLIQSLKTQVAQLEGEHAKLSAEFLPGYPRLAQVKAQLDASKARLAQHIKGVVEGINSAFFAAFDKEQALRDEMEKQKSATLALKDASVEYSILAREVSTTKQLYDNVLERLKEISIAGGIPSANVSILDRAEIPQRPSKPNKRLILLLGALLGVMGGLALALVCEHLNDTLWTSEEVENYLGLPNLVIVPDFLSLTSGPGGWKSLLYNQWSDADAAPSLRSKIPAAGERQRGIMTEAYRKLRTSIFQAQAETPPKTILFTSATAAEGKTLTIANTAVMFAQMGYEVLVIDADLYQPACHRVFRTKNLYGLTDFLSGKMPLEKVILPTGIRKVHLLSRGAAVPNPTELVASQMMNESLAVLKQRFDFLFIDSPPVMPVSDSIVLSSLVDGIIFVVEGQKTPKHLVRKAVVQLGKNQSKVLGIVLNRVDIRGPAYRDYHRYYDPGRYYGSRDPGIKLSAH